MSNLTFPYTLQPVDFRIFWPHARFIIFTESTILRIADRYIPIDHYINGVHCGYDEETGTVAIYQKSC